MKNPQTKGTTMKARWAAPYCDTPWDVLATDAKLPDRNRRLELTLGALTELGRAPATPLPLVLVDGKPMPDPRMLEKNREVGRRFQQEVRRRLANTPRKEAIVYVHGIQNTFADAVYAMSETWHFLGREGVAITYSWPAGHGGLLRGYTYDRESGEFTIFHLKQFIRALSDISDLERIHIIAHSRGTDITTTALRELFIEARGGREDPNGKYHIHNLVLAAPDLDLEVTLQRLTSERLAA